MAKACEITNIQTINGEIFVSFKWGTPPLNFTGGSEISYPDERTFKERVSEIEEKIGEEGLMLLHLAITYLKQDGTFANLNQVLNKTLTFDPYAAQPWTLT